MNRLLNDPIKKRIFLLVIIISFAGAGVVATKFILTDVALDYEYDIGIQRSCNKIGQITFRELTRINKDFNLLLNTNDKREFQKIKKSIQDNFTEIFQLFDTMKLGGMYEDVVFEDFGIIEVSEEMYLRKEVAIVFNDIAPNLPKTIEELRIITNQAFNFKESELFHTSSEMLISKNELKLNFGEKFTNAKTINQNIFKITNRTIETILSEKKQALHQLRVIRYVMVFIIGMIAVILFIRTFIQISTILEERKKTGSELTKLNRSLLQELEIAESVQTYLLPNWLMLEKNIIFSSTYTPSKKVGGDLFDMIPVSDSEYVVYVGDISGHGVQAALIMTAVKSTINMLIENEKNNIKPYFIVNRLNKILIKELFPDNYMTLLLCYLDFKNNMIRYFNAGHPPMIQYDCKNQKAYQLKDKGSIPIGWRAEHEYNEAEENVIPLDKDKVNFLYTDGIFECENPQGEQLGIKGLVDFITDSIQNDNTVIITHKIKKRLKDLGYDISPDDFTLIAFQKREQPKEEEKRSMFLMRSLLINTRDIGLQCENFIMKKTGRDNLAARTELVVNEFLNNIIVHGLRSRSDTIILLQLEIDDESVWLTFWDKGLKWNLPSREESDEYFAGKNDLDTSGRGVPIIYSLASEISRIRYDEINETKIRVPVNNDI
ncbi:MAG: SpoIIE family protein phosphatase [Candidatus Cloacimonadota bacterium]|nr:SpoIIE family protein phosphatase [Candidatus Cloacimonadota bacterium]